MAIKINAIVRTFHFNGAKLPDPNPAASLDTVRDLLAGTYPEIATASLEGPKGKGHQHSYTFVKSVGVKG